MKLWTLWVVADEFGHIWAFRDTRREARELIREWGSTTRKYRVVKLREAK